MDPAFRTDYLSSAHGKYSDRTIFELINQIQKMNRNYQQLLVTLLFVSLAMFHCTHESENMEETRTPVSFSLDTVLEFEGVPWSLEWLPNGDMLVADRNGKLLRYDGTTIHEIGGVPAVRAKGQGGLLDLQLHPDYAHNGWLYFSYSKADATGDSSNTCIARAKIANDELVQVEELFWALPHAITSHHFGSRIEFDKDGYLFFSVGERGNWDNAQTLENHSGKIHRLRDDGSIPEDNPFVDSAGAQGSIWSYGHRNEQGLLFHPVTGELWENEHGPMGGDEMNVIEKGKNYGWPKITYGINYDSTVISPDTVMAGMEQPILFWRPSIAPSGLAFVTSSKYPQWNGNALVGSLRFRYLKRVELNGHVVGAQEELFTNVGRVREVKQAPDGFIYFTVDEGKVFRIKPVYDPS